MDKDVLRKQITDKLEAEFEFRLNQARRQKEKAEEELESVSGRWRVEKRRLNAEIDRLEAAAAEARNSRPRPDGSNAKNSAPSPAVVARIEEAAEEKLKKATREWEAERARLALQVSGLEGAVADAIAQANNPMRVTQSLKK